MNPEKKKIETLKKIRLLDGKVYIRIREKRLTMTLRYGVTVVTVSDEYSAKNISKTLIFFLGFVQSFES